jgi:hypothetical protein
MRQTPLAPRFHALQRLVPGAIVYWHIPHAALWPSKSNTAHRPMSQNPNYGLQFIALYPGKCAVMGYNQHNGLTMGSNGQ